VNKKEVKTRAQLLTEIDELKKKVDDLEASALDQNRTMSQLLDAIHYGISLIDQNGKVVFLNKKLKEIFDIKDINDINHSCLKKMHNCFYAGTRTPYPISKIPVFKVLNGEQKAFIDDVELHNNGKIVPLEISAQAINSTSGKRKQVICIYQDITERKRTRKAARESEDKFRRLVDNSLLGIYITQDHLIKFCNQKFADIFGYKTPDELIGYHFKNLVAARNWAGVEKEVRLRASGIKETSRYEFSGIRNDNTNFDAEMLGNRIIYYGKPAFQGTLLDITDRKKAETERQLLEDQLHQLQKMEAIGTLAGGIAHDFNNILSAIIGYTELALFEIPGMDETRQKLGQVLAAADRARDMVKQILTFSRKGEKVRKPVLLNEIVNEALRLVRSTLPTTIEIKSNISEKLNPVMANPTQIHQVIMNICTNAGHAMRDDGGVLEITLSELEPDCQLNERLDLQPGCYQVLVFKDNGSGIPNEITNRIFEPYFTTKKGEGTGMGLAVVHGIIKNHGGGITVQSQPGKGSTFCVYLPVAMGEKVPDMIQMDNIPGGKERLLYVDDEAHLAEMGKQMLAMLGYRVDSRTSSIEALEAFRSSPDKFSLVITDQTMPNMTGIQFARELKKIRKDIPIILCTGFSESVNEENFKNQGIDAFVMKPIIRKEIAKVIRDVIENK